MKGYPKTEADYKRRQEQCREQVNRLRAEGRIISRKGIPDGWGRRREDLRRIQAAAAIEAERLVKIMKERDMLVESEDPRAEIALTAAVGIVIAKSDDSREAEKFVYPARERLVASKLLLDFLKVKPIVKQSVAVSTAEDWLRGLVTKA